MAKNHNAPSHPQTQDVRTLLSEFFRKTTGELPTEAAMASCEELLKQASAAKVVFEKLANESEMERNEAKRSRDLADAARNTAKQEAENSRKARLEADKERETWAKEHRELDAKRIAIADEGKKLELLRVEAEAGFATEHEKSLQKLLDSHAEERQRLEAERTAAQNRLSELRVEQLEVEKELGKRRIEREAALEADLRDQLAARYAEIARQEKETAERRRQVATREADAENGFSTRNSESVARLETATQELVAQLDTQRGELTRRAVEAEAARALAEKESRAAIDQARSALDKDKQTFAVARRQHLVEREMFLDEQALYEERVQQHARELIALKDKRIAILTQALATAGDNEQQLQVKLLEMQDVSRRLGDRTPAQLLAQLKDLETEKKSLAKKLAGSLSAESASRLADLERQVEEKSQDLLLMRQDLSAARDEATRLRTSRAEKETLRDENRALQAYNRLVGEQVKQLEDKTSELTAKSKALSPFPECTRLDKNPDEAVIRQPEWAPASLRDFVPELRERMAADPVQPLYFQEDELRLFVAGLAMSQLILLQGMSGTGKTSLPAAFAKAVGGGHRIIPVQAGWRDKTDLLGHWNPFEGRFRETDFLQTLYGAGLERSREWPFLLILDEMNLSRVEQYFADFNSELEMPEDKRTGIEIVSEAQPNSPHLFIDGKRLKIPGNVWFVGTANQDESTIEFADKTYDRAFVHELPPKVGPHGAGKAITPKALRLSVLRKLFDDAGKAHGAEVTKALAALDDLRPHLQKRRVNWANRLSNQLKRFVPVYVASGGRLADAVDHVLTMRLLRKLRHRHDLMSTDLRDLREQVQKTWKAHFADRPATRALALLADELEHRDRSSGGDEDVT